VARERPAFAARLAQEGLLYRRVLSEEDDPASAQGRGWKSTYAATREAAEAAMLATGVHSWTWLPDGSLRTETAALPAFLDDPRSGERIFHNALAAIYLGWNDARNRGPDSVLYGGGAQLDEADVRAVAAIMDELAVNGVLHASTKPVAARTGRMSVTDPPLQTLPRGRLIRDAFVAREGRAFVMADFAGMEMRALACEAKEENMLAAYARGEDLHNYVATMLYGPDFTKPQRTICKNGGFGKIYGAGAEKFAVTAKISISDAKEFLSAYAERFPRVDAYLQEMTNSIMRQIGGDRGERGYVELIDGRMLPVDGEKPYTAVNYKIQGSCAIVLKEKICELANAGLGDFFRLPVHDELLFEPPLEDAADVRETVERIMPDRHNFPGITLEIESDIVPRWGAHYAADGFEPYLPTVDPDWYQEAA
jgi:hypothetical protein